MSCQLIFLDKVEDCLNIVDCFVKLRKKKPSSEPIQIISILTNIIIIIPEFFLGNQSPVKSRPETSDSHHLFKDMCGQSKECCLEFLTAPNGLQMTFDCSQCPYYHYHSYYNDYYYETVTYQAASEPPGMRDGPYLAPSSPPLTPLPTNRRPLDSSSLQRLCGQKRWKNGMVIL